MVRSVTRIVTRFVTRFVTRLVTRSMVGLLAGLRAGLGPGPRVVVKCSWRPAEIALVLRPGRARSVPAARGAGSTLRGHG